MTEKPPSIDPETQLERFSRAVKLLGGVRPTAKVLGVAEVTIRKLLSGKRKLHDGFLRDTAAALIQRADDCRALERLISPAFAGNLTEEQQTKPAHGNRYDRKGVKVIGKGRVYYDAANNRYITIGEKAATASSSKAVGQKEKPNG